ncbi:MAG: zinc ribbon domain-containing protein [Solobacterium sp.]|nr:zinc ribbon domain-containing protein [Solobacterium sp.]
MTRFCKQCGTQLSDNAKFCPSCGTKVTEEKLLKTFCPSCGKEISPNVSFCRYCGKKITGTAGQMPEKPPAAPQEVPAYMKPGYRQQVQEERKEVRNDVKPDKKGYGLSIFLVFTLLIQLCVAGFWYPGFLKGKGGGSVFNPSRTEYVMGSGISQTRLSFEGRDRLTLGSVREGGCELYIENGSFPEGSSLSAVPVSEESLRALGLDQIADRVVTPVDITCDGYDGAFFDTDVVLTLPLPGDKDEAQHFAVAVYDEQNREIRYLSPDSIDFAKNTMSVSLPHLTQYYGLTRKEEETVNNYLDKYSMDLALKQGTEKQVLAELGPYVEEKIKALGLTEEAAKDLLYAALGTMTSGDRWGFKGEGSDYANKVAEASSSYAEGVMRDVLDNGEPRNLEANMKGFVNSMVMIAWDKLGYSKKINTIFKSNTLGGTVGTMAGNAGSVGSMLGYFREGDIEDGMRELGGILQGVDPVVGYTTKGVVLVANCVQMGFIEWKSNKMEELYQVYKKGGDFGWSGVVKPGDRETFLEYLNYGGGLSNQKGVLRFYNMDKTAEICEKYGWGKKKWEELDEHYRSIFAMRAENALLEYFENRRQQENLAYQIREQERAVVTAMLDTGSGALSFANYGEFFGEEPGKYDVAKRLEYLSQLRRELEPFVDMDKLNGTEGRDAKINFGTLLNYYVGTAAYSGEEAAMEKLQEYLDDLGIRREPGGKAGTTQQPQGPRSRRKRRNRKKHQNRKQPQIPTIMSGHWTRSRYGWRPGFRGGPERAIRMSIPCVV